METFRRFNPYRRSANANLNALIERAVEAVERHELHVRDRQRARRKGARETLRTTVEAILCDLLHLHLQSPEQHLIVRMTKDSKAYPLRYRSELETGVFRATVRYLAQTGWIAFRRGIRADCVSYGGFQDRRSSVSMSPTLLEWLSENPLTLADLDLIKGGESIVLKRAKEGFWDEGGEIDYAETELTRALRGEMNPLNDWLASLDVSCSLERIDAKDRHLYRTFNNARFDHGGRLFGGFWQTLPKQDRQHVRILGEHVATLDYGQTFPRLLYAKVKQQPPEGDLYSLANMPPSARSEVKTFMSALLFMRQAPKRLPKDIVKEHLPEGMTAEALLALLKLKHPAIAGYLPSLIGFELLHLESEILLEVLRRCRSAQLSALPIHDALLVPLSKVNAAKGIMEGVFREMTGATAPVGATFNTPPITPRQDTPLAAQITYAAA